LCLLCLQHTLPFFILKHVQLYSMFPLAKASKPSGAAVSRINGFPCQQTLVIQKFYMHRSGRVSGVLSSRACIYQLAKVPLQLITYVTFELHPLLPSAGVASVPGMIHATLKEPHMPGSTSELPWSQSVAYSRLLWHENS